ncbi:alpha/beta fold hydrolase [Pseudoduganella sp. FT26W]|uniref:Alpha/beta fold hydrolase n=2 Tax=Duganella aquatilis TaxID=2666082 RepID=A0A844CYC4_9BURK|nr:alpha/beta fold hydrolase [Duganella aquatilis]
MLNLAAALALATTSLTAAAQAAPATAAAVSAPQIIEGKTTVNGVRYHYLLHKDHGPVVVLLHGWGSTSYMWRFVMPKLSAAGYTVLAPDLRGFGDTDKPQAGYDKANVARDIQALVAALQLGAKVNVVGHDMGGMVAYAYAAQFRDQVQTLAILDVPLPGIAPWQDILGSDRVWHFKFFGNRDVAERLIVDREKAFFSWFHNSEAVNAGAFTDEVENVYARKYSAPGALRGGFEYYRAFPQDAIANQEFAKVKLTIPVLGIGGAGSFGPIIGDHLKHVADRVRAVQIEGAGHWVAEEQPDATADALLKFLPAAR